MNSSRIESGKCFCGLVSILSNGDPFWVCYDHDGDCRRAIGGPMTIWVGYQPNQVEIVGPSLRAYSKTNGVSRTFCSECGSSISYFDQGMKEELYLNIGVFDFPEHFQPQAHAYWQEKLPWIEIMDDLPKIDRYSRDRDPSIGTPVERKK